MSLYKTLLYNTLSIFDTHHSPSWLGQLRTTLAAIHPTLKLRAAEHLEREGVLRLRKQVPEIGRLRVAVQLQNPVMKFREYLSIPCPAHRKALTRLLLSDHRLALEELRRRGRPPRHNRLCRFCPIQVEDPPHALFHCPHPPLLPLCQSVAGLGFRAVCPKT